MTKLGVPVKRIIKSLALFATHELLIKGVYNLHVCQTGLSDEMLTYAALLVFFVIVLLKWLRRKPSILNGKKLPEHPGLPILGMAMEIDESNSIYKLEKFAKQYGEIFSLNMCGTTMIVLNSESMMRKAFCSEKYAKYFNNKPKSFYGKYFRPSGDSVAFIPDGQGEIYKKLKKTYIKALHAYGTGIKEIEDKVLREMENVLNKIDNMETKEFEFVGFLKRSLSNIVSQIVSTNIIQYLI